MVNVQNKPITGDALRAMRVGAGLTQDALAREIGLKNRSTISRYESGHIALSADMRRLLIDTIAARIIRGNAA